MTVTINNTGVIKNTYDAKLLELQSIYRQIYGADINLNSNTKNGQILGILSLLLDDLESKVVDVADLLNVDGAVGKALENICNINNIQRKGGTFTTQVIRITTDRVLTIDGLIGSGYNNYKNVDATSYGVKDNKGNTFYLINTATLSIGDNDLLFRASQYGQILTEIGTITKPIDVIFGITAVNNVEGQSTIGTDEESDVELKLRRNKSLSLNTYNIEDAIYSNIIENTAATDANIYVNHTSGVVNGVDSGGLWCIVEGGDNLAIARIIDKYRCYNSLKGSITVSVRRETLTIVKNGITIVKEPKTVEIKFDRPINVPIKIKFDLKRLRANQSFNLTLIKQEIVKNVVSKIGVLIEATAITDKAQDAIILTGGGGVPLDLKLSSDNGSTWHYFLTPDAINKKFILSTDNIDVTEI
jgi:hypothetical protein